MLQKSKVKIILIYNKAEILWRCELICRMRRTMKETIPLGMTEADRDQETVGFHLWHVTPASSPAPSIHNHKYLASFGDMAFCHCCAYDTVDMDIWRSCYLTYTCYSYEILERHWIEKRPKIQKIFYLHSLSYTHFCGWFIPSLESRSPVYKC